MLSLYKKPLVLSSIMLIIASALLLKFVDTSFVLAICGITGLVANEIHHAYIIYLDKYKIDDRKDIEAKISQLESKIEALTATLAMIGRRV
jgi:hypothetical protein